MTDQHVKGLTDHFGKANALRIAACAMIMAQTSQAAHGDIDMGIRLTIGALKRIRRHGGYKLINWAQAIEKLEGEQDEGRHYGLGGKSRLMVEVAKVEAQNDASYTLIVHGVEQVVDGAKEAREAKRDNEAMATAMVRTMIQQEAIARQEDEELQVMAKEWVGQYWASVSSTKRKFMYVVLKDYCNAKAIDEATRDNIRKRYAPKGVKPMEFVELLARYVS